jgi:hypothetical protein
LAAIPMLLGVDVVQAELKLTDDQKTQIKTINDKASAARTALFEKMRNNRGNRGNRGGNNNAGNNNGGTNNAGNDNADRTAVFAEMTALQKDTESALAKVLKPAQATRAKELAWQYAGVEAFRSEVLTEKLKIDDDQASQINEVLDGLRSARRDSMQAVFANMNGGNNNGNNGGRNNGGNNNGNNGGRNNGGQPNRPDFNDPAVQAKMAEARTQQTSLNDKAMVAIGKILKANQKKAYQAMVGAKFVDLAKINPGRRGGPGGPGGNNNAAPTTPAAATTATTPAAATPPSTRAAAATPAARKSLSARRKAAAAPK